MTTPQPGRSSPVDLNYPDPRPPDLDLAAIIGRGRRIRHRRRLTQLGAVLAACVAVASAITGARGFTISMFPSQSGPAAATPNAAPIDAQVAEDPPANGKLTLISGSPAHWTTVAWGTRRGEVCWATFRTPMLGGTGEVECPAWSRSEMPGSRGIAFGAPFPDVALASSAGNTWPVLGLTSPRAVRVVLTAFGKDVSASVVPVPAGAGKTVGVYLAWINTPGGSFDSTDVTSEAAYDKSGQLIARTSHPQ